MKAETACFVQAEQSASGRVRTVFCIIILLSKKACVYGARNRKIVHTVDGLFNSGCKRQRGGFMHFD